MLFNVLRFYKEMFLNIKAKMNEKLVVAARPLKMKLVTCDVESMDTTTTANNVLLSHTDSIGVLLSSNNIIIVNIIIIISEQCLWC